MKQVCVPKEPARKIMRSVFEGARDLARDIAQTDDYVISMRQRKKVEMLFAHLKRIMNWTGYASEDQMEPETNFTSQQQPRTCARWQN